MRAPFLAIAVALIHFTKSPAAVGNILRYGFAYVASPTKTAAFVLPKLPPQEREPQQFGMISFRFEEPGKRGARHRKKYGTFGICVREEWARRHGARPVEYVGRWSLKTFLLRRELAKALKPIQEAERRYPGDAAWTMAYHNAAAAGMDGAVDWARFLLRYQFMAPSVDAWELEWRIVNPDPHYSISKDPREAIRQVSPPQGWAIHFNVVKITPADVDHLIVRSGDRGQLLAALPDEYRAISVFEEA